VLGPKFCIKLVAQYYPSQVERGSVLISSESVRSRRETHEEDESTDCVLLEFVISESHAAQ